MERAAVIAALALLLLGFFAGAIPFGVLVARRIGGVDIQDHGSGNIGATNVTRVLGIGPGLAVLALDASKSALPVLVALRTGADPWLVVATAAAAILGHCFSPFLGFRGGKGVATALGAFLVLAPLCTLGCTTVFVFIWRATRVPALGSLAAVSAIAIWQVRSGDRPLAALAVGTLLLLVYTHRSNLAKLTSARRSR